MQTFLTNGQTDRQTDRQTGRKQYTAEGIRRMIGERITCCVVLQMIVKSKFRHDLQVKLISVHILYLETKFDRFVIDHL
jgi:hypothetical protein